MPFIGVEWIKVDVFNSYQMMADKFYTFESMTLGTLTRRLVLDVKYCRGSLFCPFHKILTKQLDEITNMIVMFEY